ncbi:MAG: GLUG motif-containing protein [Planctomycetota bacterium]|jgi:hypothetical protein
MMKMLRTALIVLGLLVLVSAAQAKYSGGSGTEGDPYQISTPNDMNAIGADPCDWDKHFLLTADIDLGAYAGEMFNIIGDYPDNPFTGVFDGNGHTISNFTYGPATTSSVGIFGYVNDVNTEIKDLGLVDPNVDGGTDRSWIGSLAGWIEGGATISNCYVEGGSVCGKFNIGGLVGELDTPGGGTVSNCYATCNVTGSQFGIGGLVGKIESGSGGTITNCYATGTVTGNGTFPVDCGVGGLVGSNHGGTITESYATGTVSQSAGESLGRTGGLVGSNETGDAITNCYATGSVSGTIDVGGLVGYSLGTITNSYSTGSVSGTSEVGGLVGDNSGTVTDSFWDKETSGKTTSAGGTGKTTAEMKKENTFVNWDFVDIWNIGEKQTYPFLRVYPAGDLNHDGRVDFVDFAITANNWQIGVE